MPGVGSGVVELLSSQRGDVDRTRRIHCLSRRRHCPSRRARPDALRWLSTELHIGVVAPESRGPCLYRWRETWADECQAFASQLAFASASVASSGMFLRGGLRWRRVETIAEMSANTSDHELKTCSHVRRITE